MKATLSNYRQSPRKVRLVADYIRGKKVDSALDYLRLLNKRAADPFAKLLLSAVANAVTNFNADKENLFVKEVRVDKGIVMKRMIPRAFGRASRINRRSSHLVIVLEDKSEKGASKVQPSEKPAKVAPIAKVPKAKKTKKVEK